MLKKTGLTIEEHQRRTTTNYLKLVWEDNRVRPVLQGWSGSDYCRHAEMYYKNGVEMNQLFGLGTVCSRNSKPEIVQKLVGKIKREFPDIKLHGFGVKSTSLIAVADKLESADSMAWSLSGRRDKLCNDCTAKSCGNCLEYALLWRRKIIRGLKGK